MGVLPMSTSTPTMAETGLEVVDLESDAAFASRRLHVRDIALQIEGMQRLGAAFVDRPGAILQELVQAAIDLCGADSAGISVQRDDPTDEQFYHWVATAGEYRSFSNALLPRVPSACGTCLERGRPQLFRVSKRFFDLMGIEAPPVADGILLPWQVEQTRGTIWIMSHERSEAFDLEDCRMMQVLANFAAMGIRQQRQQTLLLAQAGAAAAVRMANDLAHQINNPLQSLTNTLFLMARDQTSDPRAVAEQALTDLGTLSVLVSKLLLLPSAPGAQTGPVRPA